MRDPEKTPRWAWNELGLDRCLLTLGELVPDGQSGEVRWGVGWGDLASSLGSALGQL